MMLRSACKPFLLAACKKKWAGRWQSYWCLLHKKETHSAVSLCLGFRWPSKRHGSCIFLVRAHIARLKRQSGRVAAVEIYHFTGYVTFTITEQSRKMTDPNRSFTEAGPRLYRPTCLAHCSNGEHFSASLAKRCFTRVWQMYICQNLYDISVKETGARYLLCQKHRKRSSFHSGQSLQKWTGTETSWSHLDLSLIHQKAWYWRLYDL